MKKKRLTQGVALVEFSLTSGIFFLLVFCIYEIGCMLSIKNGLNAGLFYGTRAGITGQNLVTIQNIFTTQFNQNAYKSFSINNLSFTSYTSMMNRNNSVSPLVSTGASGSTVVYNAYAPHTYITRYMSNGASQKILSLSMTVTNELY